MSKEDKPLDKLNILLCPDDMKCDPELDFCQCEMITPAIVEITQLKKRIEVLEDAMRGFMQLGTKLTLDESLEIWRRAFLVMGEKPPR